MGTSGLLTIIYNKKIYSFYNNYDSGFDYFGKNLVNEFIMIMSDKEKIIIFDLVNII